MQPANIRQRSSILKSRKAESLAQNPNDFWGWAVILQLSCCCCAKSARVIFLPDTPVFLSRLFVLSSSLRKDCETSFCGANWISNTKIRKTGAFEQHQILGGCEQIVTWLCCLYLLSFLGKHASKINSVMIIKLT